jgi:hypothetical protein
VKTHYFAKYQIILYEKSFKIDYNLTNFTLILIFLRNERQKSFPTFDKEIKTCIIDMFSILLFDNNRVFDWKHFNNGSKLQHL